MTNRRELDVRPKSVRRSKLCLLRPSLNLGTQIMQHPSPLHPGLRPASCILHRPARILFGDSHRGRPQGLCEATCSLEVSCMLGAPGKRSTRDRSEEHDHQELARGIGDISLSRLLMSLSVACIYCMVRQHASCRHVPLVTACIMSPCPSSNSMPCVIHSCLPTPCSHAAWMLQALCTQQTKSNRIKSAECPPPPMHPCSAE